MKLTVRDLPEKLFYYGTQESSTSFTVPTRWDTLKRMFTYAWSSEAAATVCMARFHEEQPPVEADTHTLVFAMLSSRQCKFLVIDPKESDGLSNDDFNLDLFSAERLLCLDDCSAVWPAVERLIMQGGMPEGMLPAIRKFGEAHSDLHPQDVFTRLVAAMSEAFAPLSVGEGTRVFSEDAALLHGAFFQTTDLGQAMAKCPPDLICSVCGEDEWRFVSLSPNARSATWKCCYCSRQVIKRADHEQAASRGRGPVPKAVQREVWQRDGGRCVECGSKENLEFDHIIAAAKGGANTARNIQLLCQNCNRAKADGSPGDY